MKKEFQAINEQAKVDASFDPVGMMREDMTKAVQAPVEIGKSEIALKSRSGIALTRQTRA